MPAHQYTNFDDAYNALVVKWHAAYYEQFAISGNTGSASNYADLGQWKNAINALCNAIWNCRNINEYLHYFSLNTHEKSYTLESIYWASKVNYKQICEAWAANNFEGRGVTIAFIDRMRQLIWDEPFYVQWAAKPQVPP
jgi:hypothetical protein